MTDMTSGLENKAGGDPDTLLGELMGTFAEFKRTNEERLVKIEKGRTPDALITDKLERLNAVLDGTKAALDRAALERARPRLETGVGEAGNDEYKAAFSS